MNVDTILPFLQLILSISNICVIGYAFIKFLGKPHNSLEARVAVLEAKQKEHEVRLDKDSERLKEQDDTNEVIQMCMLALIDFELSYCTHTNYEHKEDLIKAKDELRKHLAKK